MVLSSQLKLMLKDIEHVAVLIWLLMSMIIFFNKAFIVRHYVKIWPQYYEQVIDCNLYRAVPHLQDAHLQFKLPDRSSL